MNGLLHDREGVYQYDTWAGARAPRPAASPHDCAVRSLGRVIRTIGPQQDTTTQTTNALYLTQVSERQKRKTYKFRVPLVAGRILPPTPAGALDRYQTMWTAVQDLDQPVVANNSVHDTIRFGQPGTVANGY